MVPSKHSKALECFCIQKLPQEITLSRFASTFSFANVSLIFLRFAWHKCNLRLHPVMQIDLSRPAGLGSFFFKKNPSSF